MWGNVSLEVVASGVSSQQKPFEASKVPPCSPDRDTRGGATDIGESVLPKGPTKASHEMNFFKTPEFDENKCYAYNLEVIYGFYDNYY